MALADWWSRLTGTECANCGHPVSAFASACVFCGARNRARLGALAITAALGVLVIAGVVTTVVLVRWERLPVESPAQPASVPPGDFTWLTEAMKECDAVAGREPDTLHFLVIPLAPASNDQEDWQSKAMNAVGNAVLLRSDVALQALEDGAVSIARDSYVFSVRDQTQTTYSWDRSVGVAKFSIPNAPSIEGFKVRFQYGDKQAGDEWGDAFGRRKGNCYWVNAVLAN